MTTEYQNYPIGIKHSIQFHVLSQPHVPNRVGFPTSMEHNQRYFALYPG